MTQAVAQAPLLGGTVYQRQVDIESRCTQDGITKYKLDAAQTIRRGEGATLKPAERMLLHWLDPLVEHIRTRQRMARRGEATIGESIYGPPLLLLDADRIAVVTIHTMLGECMANVGGVRFSSLCYQVGRNMLAEANLDLLKDKASESFDELNSRIKKLSTYKVNAWANKHLDDPAWNRRSCSHLGAYLIWALIEVASTADYDKPFVRAFVHRKVAFGDKKLRGIIRLSDEALDVLDQGHSLHAQLRPRYEPMIVPPLKWTPKNRGGYLCNPTPLVNKARVSQKAALKAACMDKVYDAVNAIAAVPCRINTAVLDVMREMWTSGGGTVGLPTRDNPPRPAKPHGYDAEAPRHLRWAKVDPAVKRTYKIAAAESRANEIHARGARKTFIDKLTIADRFKKHEKLWFPWTLDYRGRAYPVPQYLNYQGDDVCRGLIEFGNSKPLGDNKDAWDAVKIHAANCYGLDKLSRANRIAWVDQHMMDIAACAANPLETEFWMKADESRPGAMDGKPWQFLASCFALTSPDAASRLPIRMDGTCNALQHYAALGRDSATAADVNMIQGDAPADAYKTVARTAYEMVKADIIAKTKTPIHYRRRLPDKSRQDAKVDTCDLAELALPFVGRALVKQPTMTDKYGVTIIGTRIQIQQKLEKLGAPAELLYPMAVYLTGIVIAAIAKVSKAAKAIMAWLRDCSTLIAASGEDVRWKTPLGFPVIQPHREFRLATIKTMLQLVTLYIEDDALPISKRKQINSTAPNFIHSLDATHMMMTAIEHTGAGHDFIPIHDAFATHAVSKKALLETVTSTFVELHKADLCMNLYEQWRREYPGIKFPPPPPRGDFNINEVLDAGDFFT